MLGKTEQKYTFMMFRNRVYYKSVTPKTIYMIIAGSHKIIIQTKMNWNYKILGEKWTIMDWKLIKNELNSKDK